MKLVTRKQELYLEEVIKLRYDRGYSPKRIAQILPIGHATVSKWLAIFAAEKLERTVSIKKGKPPLASSSIGNSVNEVKELRSEIARLQSALRYEKLRADAYDEMIHVAENKFNIPVRKKVGAKR